MDNRKDEIIHSDNIGTRLRSERERIGLSQAELGAIGGVQKNAQHNYETGKRVPDGAYLSAIAGHGADVAYILTGVRSSRPPSLDVDPAVGKRLAQWRREHGVTLGDMASRIGASIDYIEQVESGARPAKDQFLGSLKQWMGIDPDWLMGSGFAKADVADTPDGLFVQVPIREARLSAGHGANDGNGDVIGNLAFRAEWLKREGIQPGKASLVRVKGDSMEPTLRDGAMVLVDHQRTDATRKDIFALRIGEDVLVKWVERSGQVLIASSENPAYSSKVISEDEPQEVQIIGRVAWYACTRRS